MPTQNVLIIQHVPWETPGRIVTALEHAGIGITIHHLADTQTQPISSATHFSGVVLMGGPMGALDFDEHPGLVAESNLVREAIEHGIPVLGVCLGHQIIATALGAELVSDAGKEFGIAPVRIVADAPGFGSAGSTPPVLHWHKDAVNLPSGATLLATTDTTPNQAFRYGSATAVQFHLEVDEPLLQEWLNTSHMRNNLPETTANTLLDDFRAAATEMNTFADAVFGEFVTAVEAHFRAHNRP